MGSVQVARRAHDLETAVQDQRVEIEAAPPGPLGQAYLAQRLARTGPEAAQRLEERTQTDAAFRAGSVVARRIGRGEPRPELLQVDSPGGIARRAARRQAALHVRRPVAAARPAVDPEAPGGRLVRRVQDELDRPALVLVFGALRKHQRAVQLHVLDDHRPAAQQGGRRSGHGSVQRPGDDDPAEDPVVLEPLGVRREQLRLEGDGAVRRVVAKTEQGVPGASAPAFRRFEPVAGPLERVARKRDPPARLPGEEGLQADRESRFVRAGGCCREVAAPSFSGFFPGRPGQRRQDSRHGRAGRFRPGGKRHGRQHRARADLDDHVHPGVGQGSDSAGEGDRLAGVPPPVGPVQPTA